MEGKQAHTFDESNLSLSCPCSSPLSVVILKEESRTPSFSLPSGKNNLRGSWSVNVPKKVKTSLIGASSKCTNKEKWTINQVWPDRSPTVFVSPEQHHSTTARPSALAEPPLTEVDWEFYLQSEHKCIWVWGYIWDASWDYEANLCSYERNDER